MASDWIRRKNYTDKERWMCIYPTYINSKKTIAGGRRIPMSKAIENPTYVEIKDVLTATGFNVEIENKMYSREKSHEVSVRGRVRVQLRNDDGTPFNSKFPTRDSILLYTAEMIPKLKTRVNPQAASTAQPTAAKKKGKKK